MKLYAFPCMSFFLLAFDLFLLGKQVHQSIIVLKRTFQKNYLSRMRVEMPRVAEFWLWEFQSKTLSFIIWMGEP